MTETPAVTSPRRKLIEVALPLEAINRESTREKSIRHGHPSTLHLWWARRPLAACRAVLFAQLVDDPSARPEEFPTEEDQTRERARLFNLIERLVVWENTTDEALLAEAHAEILKSTDGNPPPILDPFAGGGSIPLEAQRLGLEAHASDLNPVAVLINKALIEIPPKWAGQPPVFPGAADSRLGDWPRATGLAEDVRRYGQWMRDEAAKRIGHLYPKATLPDGTTAPVIAWIWARTVSCPNPACRAEIPLASTWWLSKKKARPAWVEPVIDEKEVRFEIRTDPSGPPDPPKRGRGAKFTCLACQDTTTDAYVKAEAMAGRMGHRLLAIVAEGNRHRIYLPPTPEHVKAADVGRPTEVPDAPMPDNPRWFSPPAFGLTTYADLFTNRQQVALSTFSDLVAEARARAEKDATAADLPVADAAAYADALALYLAFAVDKTIDRNTTLCTWEVGMDRLRGTFQRQALPMTWDFAEANPLGGAGGDFAVALRSGLEVIERLGAPTIPGLATQRDAASRATSAQSFGVVTATDPPYYDNIGYADLSDFFYVWLRRSLGDTYRIETGTMLTPKAEELVATPYRFGGSREAADRHFESGFADVFRQLRHAQSDGIPMSVFYAFKQAEIDQDGVASTGWEKMLAALLQAGWSVAATWPMRTELGTRSIGSGTNALASSIVLACRPRSATAEAISRRGFLAALEKELPRALKELEQGSIAPVDLAQAAIGPGMAAFSRYSKVVEADGSDMTVRTALALINQVLDEVLSAQEGDFDADTRFCVTWFGEFGWSEASYGRADDLARSRNTAVEGLVQGGIFWARAGRARLLAPEELGDDWNPELDDRVSVWEVTVRLAHSLATDGVETAAGLMAAAGRRVDLDAVKELAYLLFSVSEKKNRTETALLFNQLATSWPDLTAATRRVSGRAVQGTLTLDEGE